MVARSYARIFYRSAINQGLILIECPEAVDAYKDGSTVEVDLECETIARLSSDECTRPGAG